MVAVSVSRGKEKVTEESPSPVLMTIMAVEDWRVWRGTADARAAKNRMAVCMSFMVDFMFAISV